MEEIEIYSLPVGYSNSVIMKKGGWGIVIDTGVSGKFRKLKEFIGNCALTPNSIKLIILTHVHYDHTGNLRALAAYTGAPVLVHQNEYGNLKRGFIPVPAGHGKLSGFISRVGRVIAPRYASPKPFMAQLINENEFDLTPFGFAAKVISTPGHTAGSQAIIVSGSLISGDTFINLENGIMFPHFADNPKLLLATWQTIFGLGINKIYPGHGLPFGIEKAKPEYEKAFRRFNG